MKLHIFNPEHDIALAYNRRHLTMPHAAQELRMNLGWIPALWASDGDCVLVDDVAFAVKAASRFKWAPKADILFLPPEALRGMSFDGIEPWGWDVTLATQLMEWGIVADGMPSHDQLEALRRLSNRQSTEHGLPILRKGIEESTCGESLYLDSMEACEAVINRWGRIVLKAPWSSSGRGVRYVEGTLSDTTRGWLQRILHLQGGIMAEPYYKKVRDFGMEFEALANGDIAYCGLSLFETANNAYTGNLLATEEDKEKTIAEYIPLPLLHEVKVRIAQWVAPMMRGVYTGPFGIDMMVVGRGDGQGFLLHPCVEMNVRRTMGHVALALAPKPEEPHQLMRIVHDVNYTLKLSPCENCFVKTI